MKCETGRLCAYAFQCLGAGGCLANVDPAKAPTNGAEYKQRFCRNQLVTGYGIEVRQHMPCPACAATDWLVFRILDVDGALERGAECGECGRGFKTLCGPSGYKSMELVQYSGPDCPNWVLPMPRRLVA